MTEWTEEVWRKGLAEIQARAARDPEFRQRCFDDPHGVIREVCGQEPPADGPRVRFAERLEEQVILLPPAESGVSELSEDELEQVAAARGMLLSAQAAYGSIIWSPQLPGEHTINPGLRAP